MAYHTLVRTAAACAIGVLLLLTRCHAQQIPSPAPAEDEFFTLQVIVLSFKDAADAFVADLQKKGYPAYISELSTRNGKVLYRVRIGRFSTNAEASRYGSTLSAQGMSSPVIVRSFEKYGHPEITQHTEQISPPVITPAAAPVDNQTASLPVVQPPDPASPKALMRTVDNQTASYYTVQLSPVTDRAAAERRISSLAAKGFPAYMFIEKKGPDASLYRVRIGKYETQEAAKNIAYHVQSREKQPCIIVRTLDTAVPPSIDKPASPPSNDGVLEESLEEAGLSDQMVTLPQNRAVRSEEAIQPQPPAPPAAPEQTAGEPGPESPDTLNKIFIYRQTNGMLSLTNNYYRIPEELRKNIEYISLYPVRFISLDRTGTYILCDIEGTEKPVAIAGVSMTSRQYSQQIVDYFTRLLNKAPLRLRYNPSATTADGAIIGMLYLREGTYLNPDILKKGVAPLCRETLPHDQHMLFEKAEELARLEKRGIWAAR